jgi:hypothetical protein
VNVKDWKRIVATGSNIAEIGFDPNTGDWYYHTMRTDKGGTPNHISTLMGTLLGQAESLRKEELIFRLIVPSGQRDTFHREERRMYEHLLER